MEHVTLSEDWQHDRCRDVDLQVLQPLADIGSVLLREHRYVECRDGKDKDSALDQKRLDHGRVLTAPGQIPY